MKKIIFQGKLLKVGIIKEKGIEREIVFYPKSVAILPLIDKDKVILIKQYRTATKRKLWEIPAGKIENNETPEMAAKRELKEETGYFPKRLKKLAEYFVSPGYSSEYQYLFKASHLEKGEQNLKEDEKITKVKSFSKKEVLEMIKKKEIIDAKTILALNFFIYKNL